MSVREGKEGSRWYNRRPTGEEVGEWFYTVPLHDGLSHADYIGGIVMIQQKEKSKVVDGFDNKGRPNIVEREDLVYVPYPKVETRVAYFWAWLAGHEGWTAEFQAITAPGADGLGLPPGFFKYAAAGPNNKNASFVGCSTRVRVLDEANKVAVDVRGTKAAAVASRWDVDENAVMKAETGSVGRALGFAGMLVIPGSGVATAEDMQEALSSPGAGATPEEAALPQATAVEQLTDDQLRERAANLVAELFATNPQAGQAFQEWAKQRKLTLESAQGAALRGAVRKLERAIADAP